MYGDQVRSLSLGVALHVPLPAPLDDGLRRLFSSLYRDIFLPRVRRGQPPSMETNTALPFVRFTCPLKAPMRHSRTPLAGSLSGGNPPLPPCGLCQAHVTTCEGSGEGCGRGRTTCPGHGVCSPFPESSLFPLSRGAASRSTSRSRAAAVVGCHDAFGPS